MCDQQSGFGFLLGDVSRAMRRQFQQRLSHLSELTLAQAKALIHIARAQGTRQVEIAELLEIQPITLARLIDQLEKNGLVERRVDPADRRAYRLYLTDAADNELKHIREVAIAIQQEATRDFSGQEKAAFEQALHKILHNLTSL